MPFWKHDAQQDHRAIHEHYELLVQLAEVAQRAALGGICAAVPGRAGIGIFSPQLDPRGNSVRGIKVCEELSNRFGLHEFELGFEGPSLEEQFQLRRGGKG